MPGEMNPAVPRSAGLDHRLAWLDVVLQREVQRLRTDYAQTLDEFRGLYVSDAQVDALSPQAPREDGAEAIASLDAQAARLRADPAFAGAGPLADLALRFGLDDLEQDVLLIAAAPELDLRYETYFAYLNNDVTRKWPSVDLAVRLLAADPAGAHDVRNALAADGVLCTERLIEWTDDATPRRPLLAAGFAATTPVALHLAGLAPRDAVVEACRVTLGEQAREAPPPALAARMRALAGRLVTLDRYPVLMLAGNEGSGRRQAAHALAGELGLEVLHVDARRAFAGGEGEVEGRIGRIVLRARLLEACVCVHEPLAPAAAPDDARHLATLAAAMQRANLPLLVASPPADSTPHDLQGLPRAVVRFERPDIEQRAALWAAAFAGEARQLPEAVAATLAERFVLTPAQIRSAAAQAALAQHIDEPGNAAPLDQRLLEAARSHSVAGLGHLATKVDATYTWDELVLPPATEHELREVAAAIAHRHRVLGRWGFARRSGNRSGLAVLFTGAPGTGKTMSASVISRELGLDLYRIDLSAVVSKYIGETEKNLDRVFEGAKRANAVLFFDEADALFGKRSEVKDAHDRYANIEVAYLLQKMEDYDGVAILASNLGRNIDPAFARRVHYVVEFPRPAEAHRERLWRGMLPAHALRCDDVDFAFLAHAFDLTGGDIRNIALRAAFLAASDGERIWMRHLVHATARHMRSNGRIPTATQFKEHYALLYPGEPSATRA